MKLIVTTDARPFRRAVGVTAWAVLEEIVLDAHVDEHGALVAATNVRRLAAQLGVGKDTAARALNRLAHVGVVRRVVAARGERGALPTSSYRIDLVPVAGVTVDARAASTMFDTIDGPQGATRRRTTRPAAPVDDAQTSLFDLPASVS